MSGTFCLLVAIWLTIAWSKRPALLFVAIVLGAGLGVREFTLRHRRKMKAAAAAMATAVPQAAPAATTPIFLGQFILVAARGWTPALQFAMEETWGPQFTAARPLHPRSRRKYRYGRNGHQMAGRPRGENSLHAP